MADSNEINIKVTADAAGVSSGLKTATGDVKTFGDEVNNLAQRVQALKPDAFKELATALNAGKIDLDEFRDGLMAASAAQATAATAATELAEKSAISSSALRELTVVGRELASGNLTRLPGSLSILATRLGGIPPAAILATGAIAAFGYALYAVIDGSEKAESDLGKVQNAFTAVGAGNQFDRTQITQYLDDLRQIPGVTSDAATSIINEFARAENGTRLLGETTRDLKPLADALGIEVPQAAKVLTAALNDPAKAVQVLRQYGIQLSASQQEQIASMMAVNDVAEAQRVLLDGIAEATSHVIDTSTPLARFWQDTQNGFAGINEQAGRTSAIVSALAEKLELLGPAVSNFTGTARAVANISDGLGGRNLPDVRRSDTVSSSAADAKKDAEDQASQNRQDTDAVAALDKMNSSLKEQEQHRANIAKIQEGIDAAERQGNELAVRQGNSALETENKRYYGPGTAPDEKDDRSAEKYALAEAKSESEAANARIKTEQEVVNEKLRLGEISSADAVKQLQALAVQEHEINLKRIADMRAVYAGQGDRAGVAKSDGDTAVENERYKQQSNQIAAQGAEAASKAQQAEIDGERRIADAKSQLELQQIRDKEQLGQASAQDEIALELQTLNEMHAAEDAYFDSLAARYDQDGAAYKKVMADKELATLKWQTQVEKLNTDAVQKTQQDWQRSVQPITRAFDTSIQGMVLGTQTLRQATARIGQSIASEFVENVVHKMVDNWLLGEVQKTSATEIGARARQISESEGTSKSVADNIANTGKQQQTDAVGVFSNVYNYLSPELGPFAAVPAGVASAAVLALSLPSAAGGMIVPNDTLAMVHENEMVLPARYTSGLSSMIDQANAGGGGGGHTFNTTVHASGRLNANDLDGLHDAVVSTMKKAARNGQFGGMRTA